MISVYRRFTSCKSGTLTDVGTQATSRNGWFRGRWCFPPILCNVERTRLSFSGRPVFSSSDFWEGMLHVDLLFASVRRLVSLLSLFTCLPFTSTQLSGWCRWWGLNISSEVNPRHSSLL